MSFEDSGRPAPEITFVGAFAFWLIQVLLLYMKKLILHLQFEQSGQLGLKLDISIVTVAKFIIR